MGQLYWVDKKHLPRRHPAGPALGVGQRFQQRMVKVHRRAGREKDHDAAPLAHPARGRGLRAVVVG